MPARRIETAEEFDALAGPFLAAHEAEHNLPLGILGRLRAEPRLYGFDPTFVVAEEDGEVLGCLLRTPPHGVVLSRFDSLAAVDEVAAAVLEVDPSLPGAVGPSDVAGRFAETWSGSTGARPTLFRRQRVHAAAAVEDLPRASGRMREAAPGDVPLVLDWLRAFADEALGDEAPHVENAEPPTGGGRPTPTAPGSSGTTTGPSLSRPTATRPRAGPGRAGLHTARASWPGVCDLARGPAHGGASRERPAFCFLFTDLANPTSNAIYKRIGYEPVADWDQWGFATLQD